MVFAIERTFWKTIIGVKFVEKDTVLLSLYKKLVEVKLESLLAKQLMLTKSYVGNLYGNNQFKLMVVGRAVNGWKNDLQSSYTVEQIVEHVFNIQFNFNCIVDYSRTSDGEYNFRRSAFWQLIKRVLELYGESEPDKWYDDEKNWQEKIVWSNLYRVSPVAGGNPDEKLQKETYEISAEILAREVELYRPTHILFITGEDWFYYPKWKGYFNDKLDFKGTFLDDKFICGIGRIGDVKAIVCKRPERINRMEMALAIKEQFENSRKS